MTLRICFWTLVLALLLSPVPTFASNTVAATEQVRTPCDALRLLAGDPVPADAKRSVFSQSVLIVRNPRGCAGLATSSGVLLTPMRYLAFSDASSNSTELLTPERDGQPPQRALVRASLMPWPLTAGDIARGVSTNWRDSDVPDLYAVDFNASSAVALNVRGWKSVQSVSPFPSQTEPPLARTRLWSVSGPAMRDLLVAWPADRVEPQSFAGASLAFIASIGAPEASPEISPNMRTWYLVLGRYGAQGATRQDLYDADLRPIATGLLSIGIPDFHSQSPTIQHGRLLVLHTEDGQCRFIDKRGLRPWSAAASAPPNSGLEGCAVVGLNNYAIFAERLHNRFRRPTAALLVDGLVVRPPELPLGLDAAQVQEGAVSDPTRTDWVVWRSEPDPASPENRSRRLWALAELTVKDDQATLRAPIGPWYLRFSGQDCRKRCAGQRVEDGKWQLIEQGRELPGAVTDTLPDDLRQRIRFSI